MNVDEHAHDEVKRRLKAAGQSFSSIARDLQLTPTTVTSVSKGRCRSRRVENHIAMKLDCAVTDLWPHRFKEENEM